MTDRPRQPDHPEGRLARLAHRLAEEDPTPVLARGVRIAMTVVPFAGFGLLLLAVLAVAGVRAAGLVASAEVGSFVLEHPRHGPLPGTGKIEGMIGVLWMWLRGYRLHVDWRKSLELWSRLGSAIDVEGLGALSKLFVHCCGDKVAPYDGALELYSRAAPPKELFGAEGGFHSSPLLPGKLRKRWIAWLASTLT